MSATAVPNLEQMAKKHPLKWKRNKGSLRRRWKEGKGHKVKMKSSLGSYITERWNKSSSHHDKLPRKVKKKRKAVISCHRIYTTKEG